MVRLDGTRGPILCVRPNTVVMLSLFFALAATFAQAAGPDGLPELPDALPPLTGPSAGELPPIPGVEAAPGAIAKDFVDMGREQAAKMKYKEACKYYREAMKQDPKYVPAYIELANSLFMMDDQPGAAQVYEQILQVEPGNALATAWLQRWREWNNPTPTPTGVMPVIALRAMPTLAAQGAGNQPQVGRLIRQNPWRYGLRFAANLLSIDLFQFKKSLGAGKGLVEYYQGIDPAWSMRGEVPTDYLSMSLEAYYRYKFIEGGLEFGDRSVGTVTCVTTNGVLRDESRYEIMGHPFVGLTARAHFVGWEDSLFRAGVKLGAGLMPVDVEYVRILTGPSRAQVWTGSFHKTAFYFDAALAPRVRYRHFEFSPTVSHRIAMAKGFRGDLRTPDGDGPASLQFLYADFGNEVLPVLDTDAATLDRVIKPFEMDLGGLNYGFSIAYLF